MVSPINKLHALQEYQQFIIALLKDLLKRANSDICIGYRVPDADKEREEVLDFRFTNLSFASVLNFTPIISLQCKTSITC